MEPLDLLYYQNAVQFIIESVDQNKVLEFLPEGIKEGAAYVLTRVEGQRLVDNLKWLKDKLRHNEHGATRTISFSDLETGLGRISWINMRVGNKAYHIKAYVNRKEILNRLKKENGPGDEQEQGALEKVGHDEEVASTTDSKFWKTVLNPL